MKSPNAAFGPYRSMYVALWDDDEFLALPKDAKLLYRYLKEQLPPIGIGRVSDIVVMAKVPLTRVELDAAYGALEALKASGHPWVVRERGLVWLVNALRFEPGLSATNALKHVPYVRKLVGALDESLDVVQRFCRYYPEWFGPGQEPSRTPPPHNDAPRAHDVSREPIDRLSMPTDSLSIHRDRDGIRENERVETTDEPTVHLVDGSSTSEADAVPPPHEARTSTGRQRARAANRSAQWMGRVRELWRERFQGEVPAYAVKALRPVVSELGEDEAMRRLARYLGQADASYVNLHRFTATHGSWVADASGTASTPTVDARARHLWASIKRTRILRAQTHADHVAAVDALIEDGAVKSKTAFQEIWDALDRVRLLNAQTDVYAERHIADVLRALDSTSDPLAPAALRVRFAEFGLMRFGGDRPAYAAAVARACPPGMDAGAWDELVRRLKPWDLNDITFPPEVERTIALRLKITLENGAVTAERAGPATAIPSSDLEALHARWEDTVGQIARERVARVFAPMYATDPPRYATAVLCEAITAYREITKEEDPWQFVNATPERFAQNVVEWARLGSMPRNTETGEMTERMRRSVGGFGPRDGGRAA